jgi:hypothetical protein
MNMYKSIRGINWLASRICIENVILRKGSKHQLCAMYRNKTTQIRAWKFFLVYLETCTDHHKIIWRALKIHGFHDFQYKDDFNILWSFVCIYRGGGSGIVELRWAASIRPMPNLLWSGMSAPSSRLWHRPRARSLLLRSFAGGGAPPTESCIESCFIMHKKIVGKAQKHILTVCKHVLGCI